MARGDAEFRALADALDEHTPPCTDDPRFILEPQEIHGDELSVLAMTVCRPCPLKALCRDYATAARPAAGIWAGRTWETKQQQRKRRGKESGNG